MSGRPKEVYSEFLSGVLFFSILILGLVMWVGGAVLLGIIALEKQSYLSGFACILWFTLGMALILSGIFCAARDRAGDAG